jgi:hypothetical protein
MREKPNSDGERLGRDLRPRGALRRAVPTWTAGRPRTVIAIRSLL